MNKNEFTVRPLCRSLVGLASLTALVAAPSFAQDVQKGDRVEITGSNIKRVQTETASPVQVLSREDIDRSGKTSIAELLQTLSVDNSGSVPLSYGRGFSNSGSGISLRGLGVGATLVLINGRRVAPFPIADDGTKTYTDINTLPLEAVERIEILKDGGSATYGSDAIAGVVNIILRRDFSGAQLHASVGQSLQYGDGRQTQLALTGGSGNLDTDRYSFIADVEYHKQEPISYSNRTDRGKVGKTDLRSDGFGINDTTGGGLPAVGIGYITPQANGAPGTGTNSINGSVRDPFAGVYNGVPFAANTAYFTRGNTNAGTGFTRQFPGASCGALGGSTVGAGGGCVYDYVQNTTDALPRTESFNSYVRVNFAVTPDITVYAEGNFYHNTDSFRLFPAGVNFTAYSPTIVNASSVGTLGANDPDNPYFGTPARLRYLTTDIPREYDSDNDFKRFLVGAKGTVLGFDFDTAAEYSDNRLTYTRRGFLQSDVLNALLNPTAANVAIASANSAAYRALPAGTYYRIGENAYLNSPAVYAALSPQIHSYGTSVEALADFKLSREIFQLPGGPMGVALGVEARHEENGLSPTQGTERANVNIGYSAYALSRNIEAAYMEAVAPVIKQVELSAAARFDHYQVVGNSFTPKAGIKITPIDQLAIRGTFSRGFRAPNAAEQGGGTTAGSTSSDPVRCALGIASACSAATVSIISAGNPNLAPEKSKVYTGGFVLDPTRYTSVAVDYFKIIRKNEIQGGLGDNTTKVLAGSVLRDPTQTQPGVANDPGLLLAIVSPYLNANKTVVTGVDLDARQDLPLGSSFGTVSLGAKYTHLFSYLVVDNTGNALQYANTHGNCNVTNCIGTPWNRANADVTYIYGPVKISTIAEYRGSFPNIEYKGAGCETTVGSQNNPGNCRIGSFLTFDLTARYQATKNIEIFGTVQNILDRKPPYDPTTYGAVNYNPLDVYGMIGRFFSAGLRAKF